MHLETIERRVATAQLAAVIQASAGAEGVEVPDVDAIRADYLARLARPPEPATERTDLMRALGVG